VSWNEPGADPLADLRQMAASMPEALEAPNTLQINARAATVFAAYAAAIRLIPGRGPWVALKRRVMRWALELYFANELKPHPYSVEEPGARPRRGDADAARRLLAALADGELTRSELSVKADVNGGQASRILADLRRRGLVHYRGRNLVALTPKEPSDG
jgi:CRP-like cAMP-binding protein